MIHILPRIGCVLRAWRRGCVILPIIDWSTKVDCGTWKGGHLLGGFHVFIAPRTAERRACGTSTPGVCILEKYHNTELVYDPSDPVVDMLEFQQHDWTASEFGHIDG